MFLPTIIKYVYFPFVIGYYNSGWGNELILGLRFDISIAIAGKVWFENWGGDIYLALKYETISFGILKNMWKVYPFSTLMYVATICVTTKDPPKSLAYIFQSTISFNWLHFNYTNPGYGLSRMDTLWNAGSYRQPLEQEGNPMT